MPFNNAIFHIVHIFTNNSPQSKDFLWKTPPFDVENVDYSCG